MNMGEKYICGKFSGTISDDGKRLTIFKKDEHIYNNFNSFGLPEKAVSELLIMNIKEIVIIWHKNDDTEEMFKTVPSDWMFGRVVQHGEFEVQKHLDLDTLRRLTKERCK